MDRDIEFHGAKVALFKDDKVLVYRRDDNPEIPFPDMLDLPGGGREDNESGAECIARETEEEFGIVIDSSTLKLVEKYQNWRGAGRQALFYVGHLTSELVEKIVFGDEGQSWSLMLAQDFIDSEKAVPHLRKRLQDYLDSQ